MPEKEKKPSARQQREAQIRAFCGHLLSYPTVDQAARATGISARTATRWLRSEEFARVYVQSREATLQSAATLLRQSSIGSIETLASISKDPEAAATARVAASKSILDSLLRVVEVNELETRIQQLEQALHQTEEVRNQ